jgi:hypothetical protein
MFYIMFYAGILYQEHSDSVQIVFSPFFTVGTRPAGPITGSLLPGTSGGYTESRAGDLES